jgi:hypothetical protein
MVGSNQVWAGSGLAAFGLAERRFRHRNRCCQSQASARVCWSSRRRCAVTQGMVTVQNRLSRSWHARQGLSANEIARALISMMARSTTAPSKAGYIDARPFTASSTKTSCDARADHTCGSHEALVGQYFWNAAIQSPAMSLCVCGGSSGNPPPLPKLRIHTRSRGGQGYIDLSPPRNGYRRRGVGPQ